MVKNFIFTLIIFLALTSTAFTETLTAVCGPFEGNTIGISGSLENHKPLSYSDKMNERFTFKWEIGSKMAMITGSGQDPTQEDGIVTLSVPEQVSAVVIYPASIFLYSIFPERQTMLIAKHTFMRGFELDAARGFIMQGDCEINIK